MAEKDLNEKLLEDYSDVFADIYNTLVFGEPFLREERLSSGAAASIYKTETGNVSEQFRDDEMMNLPEKFRQYVEDYKIRVYDIAFLSDNVIEKFTSDFKIVARFFKDRRLGRDTLMGDQAARVCHVEAVLDLLSVFTKDERYRNLYTETMKEMEKNGEEVDMCWIAQGLIDQGMEKGMTEGLAALVKTLKPFVSDLKELHKLVIGNEVYAHVTEEQVRRYYEG